MKSHFYFNEVNLLIQTVIRALNHKNKIVRNLSKETIKSLYEKDAQGSRYSEIIEGIGHIVKKLNCQVNEDMILVTETIPLKTKLEEGEKLEEKSKKSKKKNKKVKKILQESTADIDYDLRDSYHKDTLRALIIMYFRILKSNNDSLIPLTLRVYIYIIINFSAYQDTFH